MRLLEFLPDIAKNAKIIFKESVYMLVCYASKRDVSTNVYLIIYSNDKVFGGYEITRDIKMAFGYVAEYGGNCQVMRLRVDNEQPIVELLY